MEGLVAADELSDKVLAEINAIRERLDLPTLQNAFQEATNDSVYHASLVISRVSNELELELAVLEAVRDLLNSESTSPRSLDPVMGPEQASNRRVLLDKFATHADIFINGQQGGEADDVSVRIEVYYKYLELPSIGPVIDGDLVVQGSSLHAEFGPAICCVEFAADHEETMAEAAVIAPWHMMFTPSANPDEQVGEFAIPISLGVEQREGHVRVRIFVERAEVIPYGEDTDGYLTAFREHTLKERFVCALDFTTRATAGDGPAGLGDGLCEGSVVDGMAAMEDMVATEGVEGMERMEEMEGIEGMERMEGMIDMDMLPAEAPGRMRVPRRAAAVRGPPQPVVVDVKIAVGFDELQALRAEGFHLSCQHLHDEGVKSEDEEGRWPYFLVAKYADVAVASAPFPPVAESSTEALPQPQQDGEEKGEEGEGEGKGDDVVEGGGEEGETEGKGQEKGKIEPGAAAEDVSAPAASEAPVSSEAFVVEDLIYLQVPREATAFPEDGNLAAALVLQGLLPVGYVLLPQDLLALCATTEEGSAASDTCIFVAFKLSPASQATERFVSLGMFSCRVDAEQSSLPAFLSASGRSLKAAPEILSAAMGEGILSGLLVGRDVGGGEEEDVWEEDEADEQGRMAHHGDAAFVEDARHIAEGEDERSRTSRGAHSKGAGVLESKDGDDGAWDGEDGGHTHNDDEEDEGEDQDDEDEDEGVALERVLGRIDRLSSERDELAALNADLQRKVSSLIAREKALLQGQSRAGSAPEDLQKEEETPKEEHVQEKEKQFSEILLHVVDARKKASQQQLEYDQLALDLQTRLDDREFKAGEIYESFRAFKKEILLKAENSRTSKPMSKRLIKQFEAAEAKREEDLERVRLRNISMRTQLKKMEKTLRAREQLAEGLYMIDFEQLKVENQTLYEKIEERSEELGKLKRKKTTTVQMLTHVREKLRFIENVRAPALAAVSLPLPPLLRALTTCSPPTLPFSSLCHRLTSN